MCTNRLLTPLGKSFTIAKDLEIKSKEIKKGINLFPILLLCIPNLGRL